MIYVTELFEALPILSIMADGNLIGRVLSLTSGLLATSTVAPIMGFNVYFNTFKAQFDLDATTGKYNFIVYFYYIQNER